MIYFENTDLFAYSCTLGGDSSELYAVNLKIDPKMFDLKVVKKVPFCSIIIKMGGDEDMSFLDKKVEDEILYKKITQLSKRYSMKLLNMYEDAEYAENVTKFSGDWLFHTVIVFIDTTKPIEIVDLNPNVIISGLPISGFVSPVGKSANYDIYNGKFIHCKAFKYNDKFNNGIVFIFAKVRSYISVDEYLITDKTVVENELKWGHMIEHRWWLNPKDNGVSIALSHRRYPVLYNGNESLFSKSKKNLFYLSDMPSDVIQRGETITTRMM